jgi:chromate transporter
VLNLSVWFTLHTVFGKVGNRHLGALQLQVPEWATFDWLALAITAAALLAMLRFKLGMGWTLFGSAVIGGLSLILKSW